MGYLNKSTITVDAVLTKKGRELLSKGRSEFEITQFAVADDEVDYTLYTTSHPLGSAYYGAIIESMPVLEASSDETQAMRYKLVSLDRGTNEIPVISLVFLRTHLLQRFSCGQSNNYSRIGNSWVYSNSLRWKRSNLDYNTTVSSRYYCSIF